MDKKKRDHVFRITIFLQKTLTENIFSELAFLTCTSLSLGLSSKAALGASIAPARPVLGGAQLSLSALEALQKF